MESLQVRIIIEILGRPPSNVMEAMKGIVQKLSELKGVKILEQTLHEPLPAKDSKDLYTTFSEIVLEIDSIPTFLGIIFAYMPSHVELISPEVIELRNEDLTSIANILVGRLHGYDAIAKRLLIDKEALTKKLFEVAPHLFKKKDGQDAAVPAPAQENISSAKKQKKSAKKDKKK